MADTRWTASVVAERMEEAAATLERLPVVRIQGYVTTWPPILREYWEAFGWEQAKVRRGPPAAAAIDRMDETLGWLRWLEPDAARIVWLRACNVPWKALTWRVGMGRTKAWQEWVAALAIIAARLDAQPHHPEKKDKSCSNKKPLNTVNRI